ncbi:MAG: MiaB/RimO family radical SAM methylthiotransferase [Sphaerochaetaceae bacterium]|nr:MiaB/RimO family radical SAM methylthiotransferase [Sphaerochaetaceae bacterium]
MKAFVYTLGCRLNQCESEALMQAFRQAGFQLADDENEICDYYLVDTCTVTTKAEQKARRMIRKFLGVQGATVIATGCYAQLNAEELRKLGPVKVFGLGAKAALLKLPEHLAKGFSVDSFIANEQTDRTKLDLGLDGGPFSFDANSFTRHSRAYLKVQDGCDNNCGYCRVHVARGISVSLDAEVAARRALEIEKAGYHEMVLTGVNLSMYDRRGMGLGGLVQRLLDVLGPDMRIRLSSMESDSIDQRLLDALSDPRVQPYFHIPVQSLSDKVLQRVNRHYNAGQLALVIEALRKVKDDPFIACDVIAGLPAEDEQEWKISYQRLKDLDFAFLHVFPYSPRPDTPLFHATDRVPESVRDQRAAELRKMAEENLERYRKRQEGRPAEAILESREKNFWKALTGNYLEVLVPDKPGLRKGDLVNVVI